jgi:hypothetical protein
MVFLLTAGVSDATDPKVIEKKQASWTCFDYSMAFAEENPEWGIVTISQNMYFFGASHMVNYKLDKNNSRIMYVHDGLYKADYEFGGWQDDGFYHFWTENEKPVRSYRFLRDNRGEVLNNP